MARWQLSASAQSGTMEKTKQAKVFFMRTGLTVRFLVRWLKISRLRKATLYFYPAICEPTEKDGTVYYNVHVEKIEIILKKAGDSEQETGEK